MLYQQSNGNTITGPGQQKRCPEMCVRWNTVLKENGQLENTPIVTSPVVPGDTIRQCPKQCDPKCCNTASQTQPDQSQAPDGGLQDDQGHPPACMDGCPKACYPACRPGCCSAPQMSMYQQSMNPLVQPQSYVQQATFQNQQPIANPLSNPSQAMNEPSQRREIIPYTGRQETAAVIPSVQYSYSQPESQTRATIPQPGTSFVQFWQPSQPSQQRSKIPKNTASAHASTCPIPCSPLCAPHCTKHCCESYD